MTKALHTLLALCLALSLALPARAAGKHSYGYPVTDPFVATVVGTPKALKPELPDDVPINTRWIDIFPDRGVPDALWYDEKMGYTTAFQKGPAGLVFIIAGTGGSHDGGTNISMLKAFYQAGFHVVSLSSPTFENFIVSACKTGVPGHVVHDAEDLYRAMEVIWNKEKRRVQVTDFFITGSSLGAMNTAFVAWLDEKRKVFNFKKALMINPPVSLYNSVSILDRMVQDIPGGVENFGRFVTNLMQKFAVIYQRSDNVSFDEDFLAKAFQAMKPTNDQLAALIGVVFRIAAANLSFTADVLTDYGYIKPKNVRLTRYSSLDRYDAVAHRLSFTDFYHEFFYPFYRNLDFATDGVLKDRQTLIGEMSLTHIEDYLHNATKIEVMTNQDDIILAPGEIDFFRRVFGKRAKIYPHGGHLGNIQYRENVAYMVSVFKH